MALQCPSAALVAAVLFLSACASAPERGPVTDDGGGGGLPEGTARGAHRAFVLRKEQELRQSSGSEEERRREQLVLAEMAVWMHGQDSASLARTSPEELYLRLKAVRQQREKEERERAQMTSSARRGALPPVRMASARWSKSPCATTARDSRGSTGAPSSARPSSGSSETASPRCLPITDRNSATSSSSCSPTSSLPTPALPRAMLVSASSSRCSDPSASTTMSAT